MADSRTSNPSKTRPQYIAAIVANLGAFAAGTAMGWSSPMKLLLVQSKENRFTYHFDISNQNFSWIVSFFTFGAAFVCLFIGALNQIFGRKRTMLLLVIPFTIGWILVTYAQNVAMLFIGRFFLGIAGGAFCVTAPTYTSEIAEPQIRGKLGSYFQLMMSLGILFSYIIGSNVSIDTFNFTCAAIPIIFALIFMEMPETPPYLISKGKNEAAEASLKWLRGKEYDRCNEMAELKKQHEEHKKKKLTLTKSLTQRSTIRGIFIILGLMFFQQMCGINAIIFYTKSIFEDADTGIDSGHATIIVGTMQVISVFVSSNIVDKLGRRLLLLPSASIMALSTIILGAYFYMKDHDNESVSSIGWLPIASLCLFVIMFSVGFGPIPWVMMGELFASHIKGVANMAGAFNWTLAFLITSTFSAITRTIGDGETFWIFSVFSIFAVFFVFLFVFETKGQSLADIQKLLSAKKIIVLSSPADTVTPESKLEENV